MDYITAIFERVDFQQIREFLLHGTENLDISNEPYKKRLESASNEALTIIKAKFPELNEQEKVMNTIYAYGNTVQNVYMEIGLKCGITIMTQFANK